jgi:hypothetical protein
MHQLNFSFDAADEAGRGEYFQSFAKADQFSFQFEVGNNLDTEMGATFYFFYDLLGGMNGFGFHIRALCMTGPKRDQGGSLGFIAGNAYDRVESGMWIKVFLS